MVYYEYVNFEEACKKANDYYYGQGYPKGLTGARDLKEKWLFFPRQECINVGATPITIDKEGGTIEPFIQSADTFASLSNSLVMPIPEEYQPKDNN
ncbi:MAG: hypothetical protein IJ565_05490 [Bacilli bacterium]|nr:hypothetical protein [Bacilli bacterium]